MINENILKRIGDKYTQLQLYTTKIIYNTKQYK